MEKSIRWLGFWSAMLTAVWIIWFTVALFVYSIAFLNNSSSAPGWNGVETYTSAFNLILFQAWMIPGFLLGPTFVVLMTSIHSSASCDKRHWSRLGVVFATICAMILTTHYYLQITVVLQNLANGAAREDITLLIIDSPHSVAEALEALGYGCMGMATLFTAPVFNNGKLGHWIRGVFIGNGFCGLMRLISPRQSDPGECYAIILFLWPIIFSVTIILLGVHLWRGNISAKQP